MPNMSKTLPIVAIIGRPNVGKSTLFNRLVGKKIAITTDIPGTTRDRLYEICRWREKEFILIDTAGIELKFEERFKEDIESQIEIAVNEAHLILFMADVKGGITAQDQNAINKIRKSGKKAILAVNKVDNAALEKEVATFFKFGLGEPIPLSAISGRNTGDLLDKIVEELREIKDQDIEKFEPTEQSLRVSILGRPNVGKSSLFNALTKEERAIISEIPGTTRDVINTRFIYGEENIDFIDTAGLRRRGKIGKVAEGPKAVGKIEKYSALRTLRALDESDIALLVIDAVEGVTAQDLHIAGFIRDTGKGIILVVNKIDISSEIDIEDFLRLLRYKFNFIPFAPVIFVSAETKKNISKIFDLILDVKKSREIKISTPKLNKFLEEAIMKKSPAGLKKTKPKLKYMTQVAINPPTFVIFASYNELIHFSYKRYLENRLREEFTFSGTPIKIEFRRKQ